MVIFPLIPYVLMSFYPGAPAESLGYRAGYLGGIYALGNVCGSLYWGRLSDIYGRKPMLVLGMGATMLSVIFFGLATSFAMALTARLLWGLFNGNIGIVKTTLSELCDSSNQAQGFAFIGASAGLGRLAGPLIATLLVNPHLQYPSHFSPTGLFSRFPFLLPCLAAAGVCVITMVMCIVSLRETLPNPAPLPGTAWLRKVTVRYQALGHHDAGDHHPDPPPSALSPPQAQRPSTYAVWVGDPKIFTATCLYGLLAFGCAGMEEIVPLWVVVDEAHYGFSFRTKDLGMLYMLTAPLQLLYQLFVYPRLAKRYGDRGFFIRSCTAAAIVVTLFPLAAVAAGASLAIKLATISSFYVVYVCSTLSAFTAVFALVSNSSGGALRGTVNGIGQTLAAIARIAGPPVTANLFAASHSSGIGLAFVLPFLISAAVIGACAKVAARLPASIDHKVEEVVKHIELVLEEPGFTLEGEEDEGGGHGDGDLGDQEGNEMEKIGK
jgi:MFS family permease